MGSADPKEAAMLDVVSQQLFAIVESFPRFKDLALDPLRPNAEARGALLFSGPLKMLQARQCLRHPLRRPVATPPCLVPPPSELHRPRSRRRRSRW